MSHRKLLTAAAVAAVALLSIAPRADAGFQVTLVGPGGASALLQDLDNDGQIDLAAAGPLNGYTFTGIAARTNTPGGPALSFVNADATAFGNDGIGGVIQIIASANDFTTPVGPSALVANSRGTFLVNSETATGNTFDFSFAAYYDQANALSSGGAGTLIGSNSATGVSDGVFLKDSETFTGLTGPYALNFVLAARINNDGHNSLNLDGTLDLKPEGSGGQEPVPAPGSLLMLATVAPLWGLYRRRQRRTETPAA